MYEHVPGDQSMNTSRNGATSARMIFRVHAQLHVQRCPYIAHAKALQKLCLCKQNMTLLENSVSDMSDPVPFPWLLALTYDLHCHTTMGIDLHYHATIGKDPHYHTTMGIVGATSIRAPRPCLLAANQLLRRTQAQRVLKRTSYL